MKRNELSLFHLERDGFKIKLRKGVDFDVAPAAPVAAPVAAAPVAAAALKPEAAPVAASTGVFITSPMVGTFYRSPGPGEKVFVSIGDTVDENTTVCIIEAMKVMNEIQSELAGTIVECLVASGTSVEFGQPLFRVKVG